MNKVFKLILVSLVLFSSCKKEEKEVAVPITTMDGYAGIFTSNGDYYSDFSGVKVKVLSTGFEAFTETTGKYTLSGLNESEEYELEFSKEGIITYPSYQITFDQDTSIVPIFLTEPSNVVIDSIIPSTNGNDLWLKFYSSSIDMDIARIIVYFGNDPNVSHDNFSYKEVTGVVPSSEYGTLFSIDKNDFYFNQSDTIYMAVYRKPNGDYTKYYDTDGSEIDLGFDIENPHFFRFKLDY